MSPRFWFAIVLALITACGAHAPLGAGQGRWSRLETTHFVLYTDLPSSRAEERARDLEKLLFGIEKGGWETTGELPLKLNVVMFQHERDFEPYGRGQVAGYAIHELLFEPWIVLPAPTRLQGFDTIAHELTHYIAFQAMQRQPRWFSEGIASYFESAHYRDDGVFVLGDVPLDRAQAVRRLGSIPPSQLLAGNEGDGAAKFYGSAWLFVHYLMNRQSEAFARYQDYLAAGRGFSDAWQSAFPGLSGEALDQAVRDYIWAGEYGVFELNKTPPPSSAVTRTLERAEEHALQALLWQSCYECPDPVRRRWKQEVQLALAADSTQVQANAMVIALEMLEPQEGFTQAKALVAAHPESWLSWVTLSFAAGRAGKLSEVAASPRLDPGSHAFLLAPKQPYAALAQAMSHVARGEREAAVAMALRAQRLQPTNRAALLIAAEILAQLSACRELTGLSQLIELEPDERHDAVVQKRLQKLTSGCRG